MTTDINNVEKLDLGSSNIAEINRQKLKELFPSVFTEALNEEGKPDEVIDFERLKAELGNISNILEGRRERYSMEWPGKKEALKLIQKPSYATLKPCREESINFDTTENLFIEGDNLEVLKLLQKSYYGKVKMIYIDPPYNTGEDFIYPDNYAESLETYLAYAGLADANGRIFSTNTPREGRFHTRWLNMMYPRLYLARNLLREDGVIFISIDDNELTNLITLCNEIFGEENFVNTISVKAKPSAGASGGGEDKRLKKNIEYLLIYTVNRNLETSLNFVDNFELSDLLEHIQQMKSEEKSWKYTRALICLGKKEYIKTIQDGSGDDIKVFKHKNFHIESISKLIKNVMENHPEHSQEEAYKLVYYQYFDKIFRDTNAQSSIRTRVMNSLSEYDGLLSIEYIPKSGRNKGKITTVYYKGYKKDQIAWLSDIAEKTTDVILLKQKVGTLWQEFNWNNVSKEGETVFPHGKKPIDFIKKMMNLATSFKNNDIILDFFSGSSSTAHAVLDLNKEDGGNRKFIMVQLPEPCNEDLEAFKAGCKTIAEIGKERIRRVIQKIQTEQAVESEENQQLDLGFKVLKLDQSNFRVWNGSSPELSETELVQQLELHIDHTNPDATQEDILYELLIKAGFMPTEKVEELILANKKVYSIAEGALLICLEDEITHDLIDEIAEAEPMQFICLDKGFQGNDQLKSNAVQTFNARNQGRDKAQQIVFRTV